MKTAKIDLTTPCKGVTDEAESLDILEKMLSMMGCCTGTIHRYDPETKLLQIVSHVGIPESILGHVQTIPIGKGIAGAAAAKREAVSLCNLQTDSSGVARPDAKKTKVAGSLAVPILLDDELRGTLGVGMRVPHDFSQAETELLWQLAAWLAPVV